MKGRGRKQDWANEELEWNAEMWFPLSHSIIDANPSTPGVAWHWQDGSLLPTKKKLTFVYCLMTTLLYGQ